jgi:hypothetical protein
MAGSYGFKQADQLTAKYLNDVNDAVAGGQLVSVPTGAPQAAVSATQPGDRIILDDATALALSDTTVGTLYGGIYVYVGSKAASTAAPALGVPAFFLAADIGTVYEVTPDAQPTAAIATFLWGVYINAISKGNWGWIQTGGIATVKYQGTVTGTAAGDTVSTGVSQTPPAFDAGVATYTAILAAGTLGVAITAPSNAGTGKVSITRSPFNRI